MMMMMMNPSGRHSTVGEMRRDSAKRISRETSEHLEHHRASDEEEGESGEEVQGGEQVHFSNH